MPVEEFQQKSITPIDDYKFTLSNEAKKFVEHEFRETDEIRQQAIQELREWAVKNPRIVKMRLDSSFLLRFLRSKKFSLPMAKETIERYLVLRWFTHQERHIFRNLDVRDPTVQELMDAGYMFALPKRDALGRRIIFYRPVAFNPSKHQNFDMVKFHGVVYESLLEDEKNQINGFVHVIDASGMGFNYMTIFTPLDVYRLGKNMEKLLPMRHKEIHGLKVHPSIKFAVDFALSKMSEKMRKRVFLHRKVEDVKNVIEVDLLPAEYGGKTPMKEMIEMFKKELEEKRDVLLSHDDMEVNIELYPQAVREGSVRSLKSTIENWNESFDKNRQIYGVQGSFRKLEID